MPMNIFVRENVNVAVQILYLCQIAQLDYHRFLGWSGIVQAYHLKECKNMIVNNLILCRLTIIGAAALSHININTKFNYIEN